MTIRASPPPRRLAIWSTADCEIPVVLTVEVAKVQVRAWGPYRSFLFLRTRGSHHATAKASLMSSKILPVRTALRSIMWLKSRRVRRRLIKIYRADVAVLYLLVEKDD